ncbi:MAG TPA: sigma-70 family RNA polymerase sigma factor [Terriglobia bacterium]|nr:sigma-70 family RNA polymerase sigma factor [Terriglobia bacterium]
MENIARSLALPFDRPAAVAADEAELVAELQAGSEDAFGYLLGIYRNPIYSMVYHIVGDEFDAADVVQNVFIKIIRGIKQFHGNSSLKTWIYRIAVHEALNYRRSWSRRRRREIFSIDDEPHEGSVPGGTAHLQPQTPYELLEQSERGEIVARALHSLAEPYRTAVMLREVENLSYEEITEITGAAEGTVKSRLKRGRELLKRKLAGCLALQE